jgi:hypothetical protein
MKRTKLLLLMALLVIPFLGARADSTTDLVNGTLTYTVSQDGGGHFAWYATTSHSSNEWGGKENCEQATSLVLKCTGNGVLNNTDIIALRNVLAANANLISVSLYDAKFTTDLTSDNGTGYWNVYGDDKHEWSGITKGVTSTSNYGSYTNSWGSTIYGYCIADELGAGMFANCTHLQMVVLPASISKIGTGSFCGCTNLKIVYVPSNITAFGWESFMGDNSLTALVPYGKGNTDLSKVTTVDAEAFKDCSSLPTSDFQSLTGVTTIGYRAFQNTQVDLATVQQIIKQFQHGNTSSSDGGYEKIPYQAFSGCTKIVGEVDLTANTGGYIKGIDAQAFENCTGMTGVKINSEVTSLGNEAFSGCTSLATVEVNSATAPTCGTDVFKGVAPNACEVVFATTGADAYDATGATGYMSYRVHQNDNDFKYLLTKTMNEDNTDYTVVPQRHADVILHRTFKEGWNTLALPFGSASYEKTPKSADADCAEIFQNALQGKGTSGASDFMIAAYRGLNTTTNTFYFLKYANVETDPLDEFEPLLIKMGAGDIASDNNYIFSNVEVNYDADGSGTDTEGNKIYTYTAEQTKTLIGKLAGTLF